MLNLLHETCCYLIVPKLSQHVIKELCAQLVFFVNW